MRILMDTNVFILRTDVIALYYKLHFMTLYSLDQSSCHSYKYVSFRGQRFPAIIVWPSRVWPEADDTTAGWHEMQTTVLNA